MNPDSTARHELFQTRDRNAALVAVMNLVFAFGECPPLLSTRRNLLCVTPHFLAV